MSVMNYRDNLVEKVGGQNQWDFIVIRYCENIQDDRSVRVFFSGMDLNGLIDFQKEFLNAALLNLPTDEVEAAMGRLAVQYPQVWQNGLDEQLFDKLKAHFIEALRDCWVEEKNVALFDKHYDSLRPLFQQTNKDEKETGHSTHISVVQRSFLRNRLGDVNGNTRT